MPKYSYENYEPDELDIYYSARRNTKKVLLSFFTNTITFDAEHKMLRVQVDSTKEYEDDEQDESKIVLNFNKPMPTKIDIFEAQKIEEDYSHLNKYSGYEIAIPLGEGVLNFCTADFASELKGFYQMYTMFNFDDPGIRKVFYEVAGKEIPPENVKKISNADEEFEERIRIYARLMDLGSDYMYKSLYSAIFPPLIYGDASSEGIKHYFNYISVLQKEFNEILEFCFDIDFYQEEMKKLTSLDRYYLYCLKTEKPFRHRFEQEYHMIPAGAGNEKFPYGYSETELTARFKSLVSLEADETVAIPKYNIQRTKLDIMYARPAVLDVRYSCSNVLDMLSFEVMKMLEQGVQIKRCKHCGKYFVLKGNYATEYCDRISDGETRSCQTIASQENYKNKISSNDAWKLYNKYYKRYFARAKVGSIKEPVFKSWQRNATLKRDLCADGELSAGEYESWLDSSFPNRKKNKTEQ